MDFDGAPETNRPSPPVSLTQHCRHLVILLAKENGAEALTPPDPSITTRTRRARNSDPNRPNRNEEQQFFTATILKSARKRRRPTYRLGRRTIPRADDETAESRPLQTRIYGDGVVWVSDAAVFSTCKFHSVLQAFLLLMRFARKFGVHKAFLSEANAFFDR
jgi:hypothetical protein